MRPICDQFRAPAHIGQGSTVTYSVQSLRYLAPTASVAAVMAIISAWAVASCRRSVMLCPLPRMRPRETMTAPMGISPSSAAFRASRSASPMYFSSGVILSEITGRKIRKNADLLKDLHSISPNNRVLEPVFVGYGEFLAAVTTAGAQYAAAVGGSHSLAETVLVDAFAA